MSINSLNAGKHTCLWIYLTGTTAQVGVAYLRSFNFKISAEHRNIPPTHSNIPPIHSNIQPQKLFYCTNLAWKLERALYIVWKKGAVAFWAIIFVVASQQNTLLLLGNSKTNFKFGSRHIGWFDRSTKYGHVIINYFHDLGHLFFGWWSSSRKP